MWMTGFDVPTVSTIYLDRPMRNHTLMQTIARANRVFPNKDNGLIVDYIGVFRNLEKALAIYGAANADTVIGTPIHDIAALAATLGTAIDTVYLAGRRSGCRHRRPTRRHRVRPHRLAGRCRRGHPGQRGDPQWVPRIRPPGPQAVQGGPARPGGRRPPAHRGRHPGAGRAHRRRLPAGSALTWMKVADAVDALLDRSVGAEEYVIRAAAEGSEPDPTIDLSKIDFDVLAASFAGRKRAETDRLAALLKQRAVGAAARNPTRYDLVDRIEELIAAYNAGSLNIDEYLRRLIELSQDPDRRRAARRQRRAHRRGAGHLRSPHQARTGPRPG